MNQETIMELIAAGAVIALLIDYIVEARNRRKELETERRIYKVCRVYSDELQRREFLKEIRGEIYAKEEKQSA